MATNPYYAFDTLDALAMAMPLPEGVRILRDDGMSFIRDWRPPGKFYCILVHEADGKERAHRVVYFPAEKRTSPGDVYFELCDEVLKWQKEGYPSDEEV